MLAKSLISMRETYTDKKIQGIAWRFVPNHGRTYPKDQAIREEDLIALRNHHDLLLSTAEPVATLEPFAAWFREIVEQTISQFRLARSEAETQLENSKVRGDRSLTANFVHSIVDRNQRQVLATLSDVIIGLRSAIKSASSVSTATLLLQESNFSLVFSLLDEGNTRVNEVIIEVLAVVREYVQRCRDQEASSTESNEESQDYGDWPDSEEFGMVPPAKPELPSMDFVFAPLDQLLSNCFGAEKAPDDKMLWPLVETWTKTAGALVGCGQRDWNSYLDSHGAHSWSRLRDTEQMRKYLPFYHTTILELDPLVLQDHQQTFISTWLLSLAERESMLKFQHNMTAALLNTGVPYLLQNLPFSINQSGKYDISLSDLRERRLSLISCILSNMRDAHELTISLREKNELRALFTRLLKQFMAAMKNNYLELKHGDTIRGSYVTFVQRVVEFLQQYTAEICSIDKFFTDSTAFPLPATDPTYVVGKLKGYALKLKDIKTQKSLAMFIQNVSERAAMDNQHPYLVGQLCTAMVAFRQYGDDERPTLVSVLMRGIFPAYLQYCMSTTCGWIPAVPILQASATMFQDLLYQFDLNDQRAISSAAVTISDFLATARQATELLVNHSGLLEQPHILYVLAFIIQAATATLPAVDYIQRAIGLAHDALHTIQFLKQFCEFVGTILSGNPDIVAPNLFGVDTVALDPRFEDVREFSRRQLHEALNSSWKQEGERFFVGRNSTRREVHIDVRTADGERDRVVHAINEFNRLLEVLPALRKQDSRRRKHCGFGKLVV
ncbi:hypothetical protein NA57DRAFT_42827 [Rhizodiscina lignyota]|uniref:Uncharacterized protein n=1 Tax=Rhizodiscina lignyota TaxID=1504668 RepID=A0A9P4IAE5_9PEZI|nr:hypothetical protein NA57DRAFT_42827 [Rhizodiscina lignyota]